MKHTLAFRSPRVILATALGRSALALGLALAILLSASFLVPAPRAHATDACSAPSVDTVLNYAGRLLVCAKAIQTGGTDVWSDIGCGLSATSVALQIGNSAVACAAQQANKMYFTYMNAATGAQLTQADAQSMYQAAGDANNNAGANGDTIVGNWGPDGYTSDGVPIFSITVYGYAPGGGDGNNGNCGDTGQCPQSPFPND